MSTRVTKRPRGGFTLVEILVVIAIVMLASIVALPTLLPLLNGRHLSEAARIFTASLAGVKDAAIRANEPRGLRLLPDPTMTIPALGNSNAGSLQLCYNRMVPIEPAADYSEGAVTIGPQITAGALSTMPNWPPAYPKGGSYGALFPPSPVGSGSTTPSVLMVEESPFDGGYVTSGTPNDPCSWFWNVRVGDKIRINGSGRSYTIIGPCTVSPWGTTASTQGNPELFVNVGPPGTTPPLVRQYYNAVTGAPSIAFTPEFLFVVDGQDDNTNGWVDEGWDGYDQNANGIPDDIGEWSTIGEQEAWQGALATATLTDNGTGASPSPTWIGFNNPKPNWQACVHNVTYTIQRRPVPTPGAREIFLPSNVVIDATGVNNIAAIPTMERSQILVEGGSLYCDIMMTPTGQFIPTTSYSTPTAGSTLPFLHFWLTDKADVYPEGTLWGMKDATTPNPNPSVSSAPNLKYQLPMPKGSPNYDGSVFLENDRRLVTYFTRTGMVTTNALENTVNQTEVMMPAEGFNGADTNQPFYNAQLGLKEALK